MSEFNNTTIRGNISSQTEWAILNPGNIADFINSTNISKLVQTYDQVPTWMLSLSLILIPIGIALNLFIVDYEKYEMDSKKRGIINQVTHF